MSDFRESSSMTRFSSSLVINFIGVYIFNLLVSDLVKIEFLKEGFKKLVI